VRDQFIAKLQRKKRHLSESQAQDFETSAGMPPDAFIQQLRKMALPDIAAWFTQNPAWARSSIARATRSAPTYLSGHEDKLIGTERGYGKPRSPRTTSRSSPSSSRAAATPFPRSSPCSPARASSPAKQLRELALELDRAGFSEASLSTAWREMTNQDIAARIVGYIRQAAIGDALVPYEQRVDRALQNILAGKSWTTPQRQWLQQIAAQTKANLIVDRAALDDPDLIFKREGGGFARLDRIFGGELQQVLDTFNESLWPPAA
jgi:type I restriction enzyme R subunit